MAVFQKKYLGRLNLFSKFSSVLGVGVEVGWGGGQYESEPQAQFIPTKASTQAKPRHLISYLNYDHYTKLTPFTTQHPITPTLQNNPPPTQNPTTTQLISNGPGYTAARFLIDYFFCQSLIVYGCEQDKVYPDYWIFKGVFGYLDLQIILLCLTVSFVSQYNMNCG